MRVEIVAFRGLKNRSIELPEKGLVRIAGDSEAGKSTVMHAIVWALFGDEGEKGVLPIGETKAGVILHAFGLTIERTKGPNKLIVNGVLENGVAQAEIGRVLGMSAEQFDASSFVKQKLKGSLLSLGAADQVRFIQTLAFGSHDPEKYKTAIQQRLSNESGALALQSALHTQAAEHARGLAQSVEAMERPHLVTRVPTETLDSGVVRLQAQQVTASQLVDALNRSLAHPGRAMEPLVASLTGEVVALRNALERLPETPVDRLALANARNSLALLGEQERWLQLSAAIDEQERVSVAEGPAESLDAANAGVLRADTALSQGRQAVASLQGEKSQVQRSLVSSYECPECQSSLTLSDHRLHKAGSDAAKELLQARLVEIDTLLAKSSEHIFQWERFRAQCQTQRDRLSVLARERSSIGPRPKHFNDSDLGALRSSLQEQIVAIEEGVRDAEKAFIERTSFERTLRVKEAELSKAQALIAPDLQPVDLVRESLKAAEAERDLAVHAIAGAQRALDEARAANAAADRADALSRALGAAEAQAQTAMAKALELEESVGSVVGRLDAAKKLKGLSDEAAMAAVGSVVNSINSHLKHYIELFFSDGGTQVFLTNEHTTKAGERRAKMGLRIVHRGLEMTLNEFSGGAENRVILATQLAISDLFGSPVLMLDEALTGSHPDLRDEIIDHLRSVAESKLVLLVEHGVSDAAFEEVVSL